ncbi:MAG: ABC transporter substrate-binding protein [Candidatus Thorarchaeota archaeon]
MLTNRNKRLLAITFVVTFVFMALSPGLTKAVLPVPEDLNVGPYVDKIVYQVISSDDQAVLAIQAGEVEMDNSFFQPVHLPVLDADPDIEIASALRNGYGHITINCRDYPTNITEFRRAFAFAFDKYRVTSEVHDGFSREQDSLVPYVSTYSIEDELEWHYYESDLDTANQLLNDAGFLDTGDADDWREAPDGTPFEIIIQYSQDSEAIAGATAQIGVDALRAIGVNADTQAADFNAYISMLDSHESGWDMVFYASNYYVNDVDWLPQLFDSELATLPYQNPCMYVNATFDSWIDQLLYGNAAEIEEASAAMQRILHYTVPRLVVYENTYMQAYRIDTFQGHVQDQGRYIAGPWTARKINPIDAVHGGTVTIRIGQEPDSFNIYTTNSAYSAAILSNLWPSLYSFDPNMEPHPDLAESYIKETHADNADVPEGHTRFTVDIIQNATWTDGEPITAEDVAFSYTYAFESGAFGNPAVADMGDLVAAYAPTPYRVIVEFNSESFWHFNNFAYDTVIPEHVFSDIGYEGWNTWNPVFDAAEPNVNAGPYIFTDYEAGEFYEISANPDFYYYPEFPPEPTSTTTPPPEGFDPMLAIVAGAVGAAVVILVGGFVLLRQK